MLVIRKSRLCVKPTSGSSSRSTMVVALATIVLTVGLVPLYIGSKALLLINGLVMMILATTYPKHLDSDDSSRPSQPARLVLSLVIVESLTGLCLLAINFENGYWALSPEKTLAAAVATGLGIWWFFTHARELARRCYSIPSNADQHDATATPNDADQASLPRGITGCLSAAGQTTSRRFSVASWWYGVACLMAYSTPIILTINSLAAG